MHYLIGVNLMNRKTMPTLYLIFMGFTGVQIIMSIAAALTQPQPYFTGGWVSVGFNCLGAVLFAGVELYAFYKLKDHGGLNAPVLRKLPPGPAFRALTSLPVAYITLAVGYYLGYLTVPGYIVAQVLLLIIGGLFVLMLWSVRKGVFSRHNDGS